MTGRWGRRRAVKKDERIRLPPVPTVKSDPWQKGKRKRLPRFQLWSDRFWKNIPQEGGKKAPFSGACLRAICAENLRLYGRA